MYMWKKITDIADADKMHIVYNRYFENSLKKHEMLRRTTEVKPIEFVNLSRQSPVPMQPKHFWGCSVNKVNLLNISRKFFAEMSQKSGITVVLSSCVTHTNGLRNYEMFCGEMRTNSIKTGLNSKIRNFILGRSIKIVVSSTDTDVLVLLVYYFETFSIKYGSYLALLINQDTFLFVPWFRTLENLKLQVYWQPMFYHDVMLSVTQAM